MIKSHDLPTRRDQSERFYAELLGQPVYISLATELQLHCDGSLAGFCGPAVHLLVKASTPSRYHGPRPGIVVCDDYLRSMSPTVAAAEFDAVVLHEIAHVVCDGTTSETCPTGGGGGWLRKIVATDPRTWPRHRGSIPWMGHDWRFVRALAHLLYRSADRGHLVCSELAFPASDYRLRPLPEYFDELQFEVRRHDLKPLSDVMRLPMPGGFQRLWQESSVAALT